MDVRDTGRRVYVLLGPNVEPTVFDDRATAHYWAEARPDLTGWSVTDYPIWTASK